MTFAFRQLQNFTQNNNYDVTFDFYVMTAKPKNKILKRIQVNVNLINAYGERENILTTSNCVLSDIKYQ